VAFLYSQNLPKDILIIVNTCFYTYNRLRILNHLRVVFCWIYFLLSPAGLGLDFAFLFVETC
jgi:hypothetical protein